MISKAAQYQNEIASLTILVMMVVALISGQAAGSKAAAAADLDVAARYEVDRRPLERIVDAQLDPIAGVLTLTSGQARDQRLRRTRRPATR
jgi:hypothetical protein